LDYRFHLAMNLLARTTARRQQHPTLKRNAKKREVLYEPVPINLVPKAYEKAISVGRKDNPAASLFSRHVNWHRDVVVQTRRNATVVMTR